MSYDDAIARLRSLLTTSTDLATPWDHFHDELASRPAFLRAGKRRPNKQLLAIATAAIGQVRGRPAILSEPSFLHLPGNAFWHGSVRAGSGLAVMCYFDAKGDDDARGLLGVFDDFTMQRTTLVRITPVALPSSALWVSRQAAEA
jgi:hypothetical protein